MKGKMAARLISGAMAVAMAFTLMPALSAKAADAQVTEGDFVYEGTEIVKYLGAGGDIVIPDKATKLATRLFDENTSITSVTFGKNLEDVGIHSFQNCTNLKKVTFTGHALGFDVQSSIGTFNGCTSLKEIEFKDPELTNIPLYLFMDCTALEKVNIPDKVTKIGREAFKNCTSLKEITLPSSLQEMGAQVFEGCTGLTSITFTHKNYIEPKTYYYKNINEGSDYFCPFPSNNPNLTVYCNSGSGIDEYVEIHNILNPSSQIKLVVNGGSVPEGYTSTGNSFNNPNDTTGASYEWVTRDADGANVVMKNNNIDSNEFISDGSFTYYVQADGTVMKSRLTYHPDGEHIIYFDADGHEVFNTFTHASNSITVDALPADDQYYFNTYGYMYKNTVTYDSTGTKLFYIDPNGRMQHSGWFTFDSNANYGDNGTKWTFTGSYLGFANYDGSLLVNASTFDYTGRACYMQGNGEAAY